MMEHWEIFNDALRRVNAHNFSRDSKAILILFVVFCGLICFTWNIKKK